MKNKKQEEQEVSLKKALFLISRENKTFVKIISKDIGRSDISLRRSCVGESLTAKDLSQCLNAVGDELRVVLKSGTILLIKFKTK